jgi:predicted nucleotidyltransferase
MVELDAAVESRARDAVRVLSRLGRVRAAYVFGSYAEGTVGEWSDLDIAAFIDGAEEWDLQERVRAMVSVQKRVGWDVEAHLFPARVLEDLPRGSFAEHIVRQGIPVETPDVADVAG